MKKEQPEIKSFANDYNEICVAYQATIDAQSILLPLYRDLGAVIKKHIAHFDAATNPTPLQGLDFGCGPGTSTPQILSSFNGLQVNIHLVGVDRSAINIQMAKDANQTIEYNLIEQNNVPSLDQFYDVIFCFFVLLEQESMEDLITLLQELHRVLKPNGRLFTVNCNEWLYDTKLNFLFEDNKVEGNQDVYDNKKRGNRIGLRSKDDKGHEVIFRDVFWLRADYQEAGRKAGLECLEEVIPKGLESDGKEWQDGDKRGAYHIQVYGRC
ncbi:MAG: class I SAM-dependent methyltransferase [Pseudomonadota bacterium]|nr:class I SAM-dependent methyltransferase [Pseudomonadota bacterium]